VAPQPGAIRAAGAIEGRKRGKVAEGITIPQRQAEQFATRIAHVKFGTRAGFQQGHTGESRIGLCNATVGLHGFFAPQSHVCCDALKKSPFLVVEQLTGMVSGQFSC
jgi:hypothetical protein